MRFYLFGRILLSGSTGYNYFGEVLLELENSYGKNGKLEIT